MTQGAVSRPPKGAWRILILAFLAQNFAIGLSLGSFGVSVMAIETEFETTRSLASLGGSLEILAMGLLGPLVALAMERFTIRNTMLAGVVLGSVAYVALWAAPNIWVFLAAFGLLLGPSVVMAGNLPGSTLVNNWFPNNPGRAVGIMMMPLFIMLVPLASTPIIEAYGLRTLYLVLAAANLLMFPLLLLVKDRPAAVAAPAAGSIAQPPSSAPNAPAASGLLTTSQFLKRIDFWLLVVGMGVLNGSGMVKISHLVPLIAEQHRTLGEATMLLTISGAAGFVGAIVFGWLADRLGGAMSMLINGLIQAATWSIFFLHPSMPLLILDAIVMGLCGSGLFAAGLVAIANQFGRQNVARGLGLVGVFMMALTFSSPPIAGLLYDSTGSYSAMLATITTACLVSASCMAVLSWRRRRSPPAIATTA